MFSLQKILVIKYLAFYNEPSLAKFICSSTVNVNTHAAVTSESKSVEHAGQSVAAASNVTKVDSALPSESTGDGLDADAKCKSVLHIFLVLVQ